MQLAYIPQSFPQVSETFIINEMWGLCERGYQITIVPMLDGVEEAWKHGRCAELRGKVRLIPPGRSVDFTAIPYALVRAGRVYRGLRPPAWRGKLEDVAKVADLVKRIKRAKPDVIVAHFGNDNALASAIAASHLKVPALLWMHGSDFYTVPHRYLPWISKRFDRIVTHTEYAERCIRELGVTCPISRSLLGIDLEKFCPAGAEREKQPTVICVARLGHNKNHERLLRVFTHTRRHLKEARLWLVGGGPKEQQLREMAGSLGIAEDVHFLGIKTSDEIPELLQRAWVKALFSEKEGLGVAFMEALACGTPCVASRIGGIPEVVTDGETGLLFDFHSLGSEEAAGKALANLLQDEQRLKSMSEAAVEDAAKRFDEEAHIDRMDGLLKEIAR